MKKALLISIALVLVLLPSIVVAENVEMTYYWIVHEGNVIRPTDEMVPLYIGEGEWDANDNYLGFTVTETIETKLRFLKNVSMEAVGILNRKHGKGIYGDTQRGNRLISWGGPCPEAITWEGGGGLCFRELDKQAFPFGKGAFDNPLVPWRSAAADPAIPQGTWGYSALHDGLVIDMSRNRKIFRHVTDKKYMHLDDKELFEKAGEYQIVHDGCFRVDDRGSEITGSQIDIFSGKRRLYKQVQEIDQGEILWNHPKCGVVLPPDADGDGVSDADDNCPSVSNADQFDLDGDGLGYLCDGDSGEFYLPKDYDPKQSYPLVVLLHGLGGNGAGMVNAFQYLADSEGLILFGPDGFRRPNPFGDGTTTYFNPNYVNNVPEDFTTVESGIDQIMATYGINPVQILVAGMSMGSPATLFVATHDSRFTHGAMLHGVRWNYDPNGENDYPNFLWFEWEITPIGNHHPLFWYSTSVNDWVTNYEGMPVPSFMQDDVGYLKSGGLDVTSKLDYPGGHSMSDQEKRDLINWFLAR